MKNHKKTPINQHTKSDKHLKRHNDISGISLLLRLQTIFKISFFV